MLSFSRGLGRGGASEGRLLNFQLIRLALGGLPEDLASKKPTWDWSYLFLLWLYAAPTEAQTALTGDLWTLTSRTDACVQRAHTFVAVGSVSLDDTELILSVRLKQKNNAARCIWMCWQDQVCWTRCHVIDLSDEWTWVWRNTHQNKHRRFQLRMSFSSRCRFFREHRLWNHQGFKKISIHWNITIFHFTTSQLTFKYPWFFFLLFVFTMLTVFLQYIIV